MKTLFNKHLCEREFGNKALQTSALLKWAESKNLVLRTAPPLDEYDIVQVESLFCAIQQKANDITPDDARAIIDSTPNLTSHEVAVRFVEPDRVHVWLVGAYAHGQWRELVTKAISDGELQLLDGVSLLPIPVPSGTAENAAPPVPVVTSALADDWVANAWRLADEIGMKKWSRGERLFSVRSISESVAIELGRGTTTNPTAWWGTQGPRSAGAIRNALKGWQFTPPNSGINGISCTE